MENLIKNLELLSTKIAKEKNETLISFSMTSFICIKKNIISLKGCDNGSLFCMSHLKFNDILWTFHWDEKESLFSLTGKQDSNEKINVNFKINNPMSSVLNKNDNLSDYGNKALLMSRLFDFLTEEMIRVNGGKKRNNFVAY